MHPITNYNPEHIYNSGMAVLLMLTEHRHGDTTIIKSGGNASNVGAAIEDYGYILKASLTLDWQGGIRPVNVVNYTVSLTNDSTKKYDFSTGSRIDENNVVLLDYEATSKTYRVPAHGGSIVEFIYQYPYTFESYPNALSNSDITIYDWTQDGMNRFIAYNSYTQDIISSYTLDNVTDIDTKLTFNFNTNPTNSYRTICICIKRVTLIFVQEYSSSNRIYYTAGFEPEYVRNETGEYYSMTKSFFCLANSKVINNNTTIDILKREYAAIPQSLQNNISWSVSPSIIEQSVTWDTQTFILYRMPENATLTITL